MKKLREVARGLRKIATRSSYNIDKAAVLKKLTELNNREIQQEELRENGKFVRHRFAYIPLSKIRVPPIWSQAKLEAIRKEYTEGKSIFPVRASLDGDHYIIEDGIHRVNFSLEQGFTEIPAIIDEFAQSFD